MNVGIITTWFDRGAAYVSRAYMEVLQREHNVFIFARGGEQQPRGDSRWDLPNVTWCDGVGGKPYMYIDWQTFETWLDENKIDILLFNEQQDWDIILRLQKKNIPFGAYIDYYTTETWRFYNLYDFLICNTQRHYSVFKDHPQCFYIPWGTDLDLFKPHETEKRPLTFFHSCGVNPFRKGTYYLVNAFNRIQSDAKLIIHSQLPLQNRVPDLYKAICSNENITLIEQIIPPPGLFHKGDVYVYPSELEGIGLTIAEALASGLPVITTNEPPMNEFIIEGFNGKLVDVARYEYREDNYYWQQSYCDVDSLIQAIEYYIENEDKIDQIKKETRFYAEQKLDWYKNAGILNSLFPQITINNRIINRELYEQVRLFEKQRIRQTHPFYQRIYFLIRKKAGNLKKTFLSKLNLPFS